MLRTGAPTGTRHETMVIPKLKICNECIEGGISLKNLRPLRKGKGKSGEGKSSKAGCALGCAHAVAHIWKTYQRVAYLTGQA